jgi:GNAT superfamily N-acetyltransferase
MLRSFLHSWIKQVFDALLSLSLANFAHRAYRAGRRLLAAVVEECQNAGARLLRLSCPAELPANAFYEAVGFLRVSPRSRPGKLRPLIEWQMATWPLGV